MAPKNYLELGNGKVCHHEKKLNEVKVAVHLIDMVICHIVQNAKKTPPRSDWTIIV